MSENLQTDNRMVRCASCKHWGTEPGRRGNPRLRSCGHQKHVMGYQSAADVPDDGMIIESDEGWGMEVGPLFGCVNGEASTPNGRRALAGSNRIWTLKVQRATTKRNASCTK